MRGADGRTLRLRPVRHGANARRDLPRSAALRWRRTRHRNEVGLLRRRYFSPQLARFLNPDDPAFSNPGEPQSTNQYAYAHNNPLVFVDPSGHEPCLPDVDVCVEGDNPLEKLLQWAREIEIWNDIFRPLIAPETPTEHIVSLAITLPAGPAGVAVRGGRAALHIGVRGLRHVMARHAFGGARTAGKSLFSQSENIAKLIRQASSAPRIPQGNRFQRTIDAGRQIGIDRATGKPTSIYTVITNSADELVTAFPGRP